MLRHAVTAGRRIALHLDGHVFDEWTLAEIDRDLSEISGSFHLGLRDAHRSFAAWPFATLASYRSATVTGLEAVVAIDGEPVLVGWVEEVVPEAREGYVQVAVSGRDRTGDLVDSSVAPEGPSELRDVDLLEVAKRAVEPFGLDARAETDLGEPFERYTADPAETVLSYIEKGARQRAVLVTSDGVGAVVLTRSGQGRAPGEIVFPGDAFESGGRFSSQGRHSDYHVKGQAERAAWTRKATAPLDARAEPGEPSQPDPAREERGVLIHGHARDEEIRRHRPLVALARTQTRRKAAQDQAEWMKRTARAESDKLDHALKDYRGQSGALWRPNELVFVDDRFQGVHRDMLVAGVVMAYGHSGAICRLRLTGPDTYDLEPEGDRRQNRSRGTADA